jgi:hypothetical protein
LKGTRMDADDVRRVIDLLKKHPLVLRELRCIDLSEAKLETHTLQPLLQVLIEQQGGGVRVLDLSSTRLGLQEVANPRTGSAYGRFFEAKPIPSGDFPLLGLMVQACPALRVLRLACQTGPNDLREQQGKADPGETYRFGRHASAPQTDFSQFMAGVGSSGITHIDLSECRLRSDDLDSFLIIDNWRGRPLLGHSGLQHVNLSGNTEALFGPFGTTKDLSGFVKYFLERHKSMQELRLPEGPRKPSEFELYEKLAAKLFAPVFDAVNAHSCIEVLSPFSDMGGGWQPIGEKLSANAARRQAEENRLVELPLILSAYDVPKEVVDKIMNYALRL